MQKFLDDFKALTEKAVNFVLVFCVQNQIVDHLVKS